MKKTYLLILILIFLFTGFTFAANDDAKDSTSSATPTKAVTDKIQELKERVASRVATLKKEKMGGMSGILKSTSASALILTNDNSDYSVQLDEETKLYLTDLTYKKKEIKANSLEKDKYITLIGTIDNEEKSIVAKTIIVRDPNEIIQGKIEAVSTKDGSVTVKTKDGKSQIIDIELASKINLYDQEKAALVKLGMSKIEIGSFIQAYAVKIEEGKYTGLRLLIVNKNQPAPSEPTLTPSPSPKSPTPTKS